MHTAQALFVKKRATPILMDLVAVLFVQRNIFACHSSKRPLIGRNIQQ